MNIRASVWPAALNILPVLLVAQWSWEEDRLCLSVFYQKAAGEKQLTVVSSLHSLKFAPWAVNCPHISVSHGWMLNRLSQVSEKIWGKGQRPSGVYMSRSTISQPEASWNLHGTDHRSSGWDSRWGQACMSWWTKGFLYCVFIPPASLSACLFHSF